MQKPFCYAADALLIKQVPSVVADMAAFLPAVTFVATVPQHTNVPQAQRKMASINLLEQRILP